MCVAYLVDGLYLFAYWKFVISASLSEKRFEKKKERVKFFNLSPLTVPNLTDQFFLKKTLF